MEKPFWEKTYSDLSVATFGKKPANDILKISSSLKGQIHWTAFLPLLALLQEAGECFCNHFPE